MNITTILPVSRFKYLDRVLGSLLSQTVKPDKLIVICDVPQNQFNLIRNKISELDIDSVCVKSKNGAAAQSIKTRRKNISNIHNHFKELVGETDWIFSIEDDGVLPNTALERLLNVAQYKNVGMVTGVELGRWSVRYVGAWRADSIKNTKLLTSIEKGSGVEEIDACGLYCALINPTQYKSHKFTSDNGLGPDVNLGLFMRRNGFNNYIDWGVPVTHLTNKNGLEIEIPPTDTSRVVTLNRLSDTIWKVGS